MSSKYCSSCIQKLPLSSFFKDTLTSLSSRVYSTCIQCRNQRKASNKKQAALQSLDPNIQPTKRVRRSDTGPQPTVQAPLPLNPPEPQPQALVPLAEPIETDLNPLEPQP